MGRIKRNSIIILVLMLVSIDVLAVAAGWEIQKNGREYDYAAMRLDSNAIFMDLSKSDGRITEKIRKECRRKKLSVLIKELDDGNRDSYGKDIIDFSLSALWGTDKGKKGILFIFQPLW